MFEILRCIPLYTGIFTMMVPHYLLPPSPSLLPPSLPHSLPHPQHFKTREDLLSFFTVVDAYFRIKVDANSSVLRLENSTIVQKPDFTSQLPSPTSWPTIAEYHAVFWPQVSLTLICTTLPSATRPSRRCCRSLGRQRGTFW